jgi:fructokinase
MARLADNAFGRLLRDHATQERVDLSHAPKAAEPTTLAVVGLDLEARATYDFYADGTADWQWSADEAARVPAGTAVLHMGSLASWMPPGDERIHDAAARLRRDGRALVSYDPTSAPRCCVIPRGPVCSSSARHLSRTWSRPAGRT